MGPERHLWTVIYAVGHEFKNNDKDSEKMNHQRIDPDEA
jgi:hypothetical protein